MIGVSIVTYRSRPRHVRATLEALARQSLHPDVIVVHQNAATSWQALPHAELAAWAAPVGLVETSSGQNIGFTGAHNRSLERLFGEGCEAVLVLNPDLVLAPDAVAELDEVAAQLEGLCLLGPVLELCDADTLEGTGTADTLGTHWTRAGRHLDIGQGGALPPPGGAPYQTAAVSGACLFVPRRAHEEIVSRTGEFFDEDFFAYREDAELGYRAELVGVPSIVVPAARGQHVRRLRGTTRGLDPDIDRLSRRNRLLLAFKYGVRRPGWPPLAVARDALVVVAALTTERSSLQGVREALQLRAAMHDKRRRIRSSVTVAK